MPAPPSRRRPGRPSLDPQQHPSVSVAVRLSTAAYDAAYARARAERVTISEWIRRRLRVGPPRDQNQ
jgi:hypothetical protein